MARLQILELPTLYREDSVDETPFVLVIDQADETIAGDFARNQDLATRIGARALLVFEATIDIPANKVTLSDATDGNVVRIRVEPDLEGFTDTVMAEVFSARTKAAEAISRNQGDHKVAITDALGMDRTRDWDDIVNAAAGIRRSRDSMRDAIQRVRDLHRPVEYRGMRICAECSAYDGNGSCDNSPAVYDQCTTTQATRDPQTASASRE